jgi:predicted nucleic acid-binding protein
LIVPVLCVAEVTQLASARLGSRAELRFLEDLIAGSLFVEQLHPADLVRAAELVAIYRDLPLGTVDGSVVATAERLGATTLATLDRRHFSVVRPAHAETFDLLP